MYKRCCNIWSISEGVEITGMWQLLDIKVNRRHVAIRATPTHLIDSVEKKKMNNNKYII